jgi:UDP-glucose 4-epimerase
VRQLLREGHDVTVVDNLSKGHRHNVPADRLYEVDIADTESMTRLIRKRKCESVIHFAAFIAVGESMRDPARYFKNNVCGSIALLEAMAQSGVKHMVFSSTAAVYGNPHTSPIREEFPIQPVNPYGESKVMIETALGWFDRIHNLTSVVLRYFNASGADPEGGLGEEHEPETHLIPLIFRAIETGSPITVFGNDYPTPDGTCIRDYIHVNDLAQAHILALDSLTNGGASERFNVGTGTGHTVLETIRAAEEVTGKKVPYVMGPRREGDAPALVASSEKIRERLRWSPKYENLRVIIEHAWKFERSRDVR